MTKLAKRTDPRPAGWLSQWSNWARANALGLVLTAGFAVVALPGSLIAAEGDGQNTTPPKPTPPVQPDPRPVRPVAPIQPVQLPREIEDQIHPGPMPGEPTQLGPSAPPPDVTPPTPGHPVNPVPPATGTGTEPGTRPQPLNPGKLPPPPHGSGILTPPPVPVPNPGGDGNPPPHVHHVGEPLEPGETTQPGDQPEVHADVHASTSVKDLLAKADQKLDPGTSTGFSDADWQEFTTVIGGTPEGNAIADVPEEVWQDYQTAERSLRQAVWSQIFGRADEAAQLAENARTAYQRIGPQLKGDGVYNVVQRVAWGARIRKKYLLNDVMMVPGERGLMTENLNVLNREYRLYLVFQQQDPVKQRHNRVILIGEIWRNMKDHQAPDRALAAVHKSMTAQAEAVFDEDTREENPIGALIPGGDDSMAMLATRNSLWATYDAMIRDYELFSKKQRDTIRDLGDSLKLETDARQIYDQRRVEFTKLEKDNRWSDIKALSLTVNGETLKYKRTYAKDTWLKFAAEVDASFKAQSDKMLADYSKQRDAATEGDKLVALQTDALKDTQVFGYIDAQNWNALNTAINIKIVEVKQSRGQKFLEDIRTQTQNTTTKDGLDQIKEKLNSRQSELIALQMKQEYEGVLKDINDRIDRFSQIAQAAQQQTFYVSEVTKQKTSTELVALQDKIRKDRTAYAAVLDIPKWDELQQKVSLQLDVLLKQEFVQLLSGLEKKAEAKKTDLLALEEMVNTDLVKAGPEAKRWGLIDRFNRLSDTVNTYQRNAQVTGIQADIARYNDELARAKSDHDISLVVQKFKSLEESARSLPIPQTVRDQIRANKADAETWRESAKSAQTNIESAESALRDGL